MDKIAFRNGLLGAVAKEAEEHHLPMRHRGSQGAFALLTEQYASIVSMEGRARREFHQDALDRAYRACISWTGDGISDATPDRLIESSSLGADYGGAMRFMPDLLRRALDRFTLDESE